MKVKSLDKNWKEFLYAFSGFGPNFLMVLMGAFFTDALNPTALDAGSLQAIMHPVCFILPAIFPILYAIAKVFDGIIDIPFAYITDTLSTKWGRRRPAIAVCTLPMIVSFVCAWIPIGGADESAQLINTIWICFWCLVFFATYTMCLIAFYGSLSTVCSDESQRLRVSGYKSFFDTISYCIVYGLVPLLLDAFEVHIDKFVFFCIPLMLTILIPLFLIKEGEKYGYPENDGLTAEKISIFESVKITFKNVLFRRWLYVNCCTFFGLQMFLVGMNAMINGGMGFNGAEMALVNTCAFAPVPIMLYLFNKLKAKKGIRFTYQTCLIAFAVAIMSFFFASTYVTGGNKILQYAISCIGGVIGSWGIGAFFMVPYHIPAQISSVEERLTGKNHSAMYFAANAVTTSIVGAISGSLVYENIKNLFISKEASGIEYAVGKITDTGEKISAEMIAAEAFGVSEASVFNLGTLVIPFIVCIVCILGAILAMKMPKDYTPVLVAAELKKFDSSIDVTAASETVTEEKKGEIIFVQIGLSVLSGFIFGFIWLAILLRSVKELTGKGKTTLTWLLSSLIPFASVYFTVKLYDSLASECEKRGIKPIGNKALYVILSVLFPILPINVIALALLQSNVNRLYNAD
ncbi:MAG: MFS transporter [Clostridia bacterium]|nr:MFS transporter [Clostridia bacterium]